MRKNEFVNMGKKYLYLSLGFIFLLLLSCVDEEFVSGPKEGYIRITGINTRSYDGSHPGDGIDSRVETLRIIAFYKTGGGCASNVFYSGTVLNNTPIQHKIDKGEYDFVFLANEPSGMTATLDNIGNYNNIQSISYPASAFNSNDYIPMIAENKNIKILTGGNFEVDGSPSTELHIRLRRLAARIDVILKSTSDLGNAGSESFKGVTFSKIADRVPLVHGLPNTPPSGTWIYNDPTLSYNGTAVGRNVERKLTLADNPGDFEINPGLLDASDRASGLIWAAKVKRVIIPSVFFTDKAEENNAIVFTVNLVDKYSPSCKLKILDLNHTLPANAKLDLTGIIKEPLLMNIVASPWELDPEDWEIAETRQLNVSHTSVKMTDMNGVRVSFWSNMPKVSVSGTVQKTGEASTRPTNEVFNCLAVDANNDNPFRFVYDPVTGSGYMDLLIDGTYNTVSGATHDRTENMTGTYQLTLSATNEDGTNALSRTIDVEVTQDGLRFRHNPTANAHGLFNAAFFKHNQKGERIITGQHALDKSWSVEVPSEYQDWLIVSATPSFDPKLGTDSPGDAEHYPVTVNPYKTEETGLKISGLKGRIYFRIGIRVNSNEVPNKDAEPKFGYVTLYYNPGWATSMRIYVRQGEAGAYIYDENAAIPDLVHNAWNGNTDITGQVREDMRLTSQNSRLGAAKISPYNLTSENLAGNTNPDYGSVGKNNGRFVDFPSQAGAFFQWAVELGKGNDTYYRRAYNPSKSASASAGLWDYPEFAILWDGDGSVSAYKTDFEVCPPGYRRPNDGHTDKISHNGYYDYLPAEGSGMDNHKDDIELSELRVSLFNVPFAGNAASSADYKTVFNNVVGTRTGPGTYPYGTSGVARKQLRNTTFTFYSDGFFDRRPIKEPSNGNYGVSLENSKVAYQGILFFNPATNASVFFPATGRLNNTGGALESAGSTGYYWTSSIGPPYTNAALEDGTSKRTIKYGGWSFEANYNAISFKTTYQGFAQAIRCVKE